MVTIKFPGLNSKMAMNQEEFEASVKMFVDQYLFDTSFEVLDGEGEVIDLLSTGFDIEVEFG